MKVLILGAGAVGGWFGGKLLEYLQQQQQQQRGDGGDIEEEEDPNHPVEVTFLVRSGRASQLESDGLVLDDLYNKTKCTVREVPCLVSGTASSINNSGSTIVHEESNLANEDTATATTTRFDIIILACKSYGLDGSMEAIAPYVYPGVAILPLLNGMSHLHTIQENFPQSTVWGGTCGIVASLNKETGVISKLTGAAWVKFGTQQASTSSGSTNDGGDPHRDHHLSLMETLARTWKLAGIEAEHVNDGKISQAMWNKWIFLASLGASVCLWQGTTGDIVRTDYGEELVVAMIKECELVANAEQSSASDEGSDSSNTSPTRITYEMIKKNFLHADSPFKTSMGRDMDQGFPTEASHLIGDLIVRAKRHDIDTPLLCASYTRLQIYEAKRPPS